MNHFRYFFAALLAPAKLTTSAGSAVAAAVLAAFTAGLFVPSVICQAFGNAAQARLRSKVSKARTMRKLLKVFMVRLVPTLTAE